jgi:N,N-dimethylformamidase beta subunit-like protein/uncharacterized protein DUF4082/Big-like domain-containing protein
LTIRLDLARNGRDHASARPRRRAPLRLVAQGVGVGLLLALLPTVQAHAAPCDPPITNPIACENTKPGNPPSEWDVSGGGSSNIEGFATDISVDQGQTIQFKVDTNSSNYRIDIYRLGYYGGMGARRVATVEPSAPLPQNQPACLTNGATGLIDCGNWSVSASWAVPADAVSGVYIGKLVREDGTSGSNHIPFIVRDDDGHSDLLFQTSDTTWQAYNQYGGNSLYVGNPAGRAYKVSYNRPFTTRSTSAEDWVFNAEYPMIRFLERNGYSVSYFTGVDTARRGAELLEHKVFMSVGHDEYWAGIQRTNVEAARAAGVNLAFFSGNEVFWKTRWESSTDASATPFRTLVCYKETHANEKIDPTSEWTGTWRDPRFSPPSDGGRPENGLTGTIFTVNDPGTFSIQVPADDGRMRFWRNTNIATLAPGQVATLEDATLGYEWDEDLDNGFRPAGLFHLSTSTFDVPSKLQDYGSSYGPGTATHHLTLYRAASGALVFGAGTVQWSWGLDGNHDRGTTTPDSRMQQATVNLLADMGAQPGTLQSGLVAATASTDATPPTAAVTSPADGSTVQVGTSVAITGTASDAGGGVVGGVEVSVDGGTTWHPANGRENWSYSWIPQSAGTASIRARAIDDSGNIGNASPARTITVQSGGPGPGCPCSIWNDATVPSLQSDSDTAAVEVGVKFQSSVDGYITALRFYKGAANTGSHVGHLWTRTGSLLATVTFQNESSSGWQQQQLSTPVPVTAGTTYVASYHTDVGRYSADTGYFAGRSITNGPLRALADGDDGPNGVYQYGASGFPTDTFGSTNYWVDVVLDQTATDTQAPRISNRSPLAGATGVATTTNVTATFDEPVDPGSISFGPDLRRAVEDGASQPECRAPAPDDLHGDGQRGSRPVRKRHGEPGLLVVHDDVHAAAAPRSRAGRADPGDRESLESVQPLLRGDPPCRRFERIRRPQPRLGRCHRALQLRRRHPRRDVPFPEPGDHADQLGERRRQPHRDAPGQATGRSLGSHRCLGLAGRCIPAGQHFYRARYGHHEPDDPVPRLGRSVLLERCHERGHTLFVGDHPHVQPCSDPPQCWCERR